MSQLEILLTGTLQVGVSGASLVPAARIVVLGGGAVTDTVKVPAVLTPLSPSRGSVTLSPAYNLLQLCSPVVSNI